MADIQSILKPRRGKKSTMAGTKANTVLQSGEIFIEVPDTGVGKGASKIKVGDGSTAYSSLPYALGDTENDKIAFTENTSTTAATALNSVTSGAALKTIIAGLKKAVSLNNTTVTKLNDERVTPVIEDGKITGFKIGGADTVYPFKKSDEEVGLTFLGNMRGNASLQLPSIYDYSAYAVSDFIPVINGVSSYTYSWVYNQESDLRFNTSFSLSYNKDTGIIKSSGYNELYKSYNKTTCTIACGIYTLKTVLK